jgi:hypothetical protein
MWTQQAIIYHSGVAWEFVNEMRRWRVDDRKIRRIINVLLTVALKMYLLIAIKKQSWLMYI